MESTEKVVDFESFGLLVAFICTKIVLGNSFENESSSGYSTEAQSDRAQEGIIVIS